MKNGRKFRRARFFAENNGIFAEYTAADKWKENADSVVPKGAAAKFVTFTPDQDGGEAPADPMNGSLFPSPRPCQGEQNPTQIDTDTF